MIRNLKKYLLLPFLFFGLLFGCSQDTLTIGFSASLTGTTSELGISGRNGLNLAIETINAKGGVNGRTVNVIVKDDENDPALALSNDRDLYALDVNFIIGHMTSNMAEQTLAFINEKDMLMISPSMSSNKLSGLDDHFLRVVSSNEIEADFMAKMINQCFTCNKVAILYESKNEAYTVSFKNYLTDLLKENGSQVVEEISFESGNNPNYFENAQKIMASDADSIVILASSFDTALFCQQFYKLSNDKPLFLPTWVMDKALIQQGGPAVEGINIVSYFDPASERQSYLDFKEKYRLAYKQDPSFSAVYTYEAAMILFDALEQSPTSKPESVKQTILENKTYQGLQGVISFDSFGDPIRDLYHYTIKNGQFKKVNNEKK